MANRRSAQRRWPALRQATELPERRGWWRRDTRQGANATHGMALGRRWQTDPRVSWRRQCSPVGPGKANCHGQTVSALAKLSSRRRGNLRPAPRPGMPAFLFARASRLRIWQRGGEGCSLVFWLGSADRCSSWRLCNRSRIVRQGWPLRPPTQNGGEKPWSVVSIGM